MHHATSHNGANSNKVVICAVQLVAVGQSVAVKEEVVVIEELQEVPSQFLDQLHAHVPVVVNE